MTIVISNYFLIISLIVIIIFYHSFYYRPERIVSECDMFTLSEYENEFRYNYSIMLKNYGLNEMKFYGLPYFGYINNYETHTFQGLADHIYPIANLSKVKCGDIIFIKGDYVNKFFNATHPNIPNPYILMSHNSPHSMGEPHQLKFLDDTKVIAWFAKNAVGK